MIELPIEPAASQRFTSQLGTEKYTFTIDWNYRADCFMLTMVKDIGSEPLMRGVPVVLGADLLDPYNYLIGSLLLVDTTNLGKEATIADFGVRTKLYWFSQEELDDLISSPV